MKDSKDKIYSFRDSNRIGKLGEQEVLGYLEKILPNLNKIENVTLNKEYQKKDCKVKGTLKFSVTFDMR